MMNIRLEQPKDYREVENLTREAFWNVYRPGCTEHFVLNQYRTNPDFIPELDFVMEEDNRIIGHVMFSKASLAPDPSPMGEGSDDPSQQEMHTTPLPREGLGGLSLLGLSAPSASIPTTSARATD